MMLRNLHGLVRIPVPRFTDGAVEHGGDPGKDVRRYAPEREQLLAWQLGCVLERRDSRLGELGPRALRNVSERIVV